MISDYDSEYSIYDVEFNGDICDHCVHCDTCVLINQVQAGNHKIENPEPLIYCTFHMTERFKPLQRLKQVFKILFKGHL